MTAKGRILVIDDNDNLRMTMERVLRMKGHDVLTTCSSVDALEIAKTQNDIDLIFVDINLPSMNGVETHRQLKEIVPNSVVLMTGSPKAVADFEEVVSMNSAYSYLYKPLDMVEVFEIVDRILSKKQEASEWAQ